jgi:hypothetical protein
MPFMVEENGKRYDKRHSHCEEGPTYPRSVMVSDIPRFRDTVKRNWDKDGDDGYSRDSNWKSHALWPPYILLVRAGLSA